MAPDGPEPEILIISPQMLISELLAQYLNRMTGISAQWCVHLDQVNAHRRYRLVILDLDPRLRSRMDAIHQARDLFPDAPIVLLTDSKDTDLFMQLVESGVAGIIPRQRSLNLALAIIRLVLAGEKYIPAITRA